MRSLEKGRFPAKAAASSHLLVGFPQSTLKKSLKTGL